MNLLRPSTFVLAGSLALLSACSAGQAPATSAAPPASPDSPIVAAIDHALDTASAKLADHDITVSDGGDGRPEAVITPQGEFLIAGKAVALTPAQQADMRAYREQVVVVARAGIVIGKQGASLGMNAASEAIAGALSGQSNAQIRSHVEAKASGIRAAAAKLCEQLPAMQQSQQKLAAEVPAFMPYATLTPAKIDECRKRALHGPDD